MSTQNVCSSGLSPAPSIGTMGKSSKGLFSKVTRRRKMRKMSNILYVVVRNSLSFPDPLNRYRKHTRAKRKVTKSIDPLLPIQGSPSLYQMAKLDEL